MRLPEDVFGESAQKYCVGLIQEIIDEMHEAGNIPFDTGTLSRSYRAVENSEGGGELHGADYALHVEYGTETGSPEQLHIRPAIEVVRARHAL